MHQLTEPIGLNQDESFFLPRFSEGRSLRNLMLMASLMIVFFSLVSINSWSELSIYNILANAFFVYWITLLFAFGTELFRTPLLKMSRMQAKFLLIVFFEFVVILVTIVGFCVQNMLTHNILDYKELLLRLSLNVTIGGLVSWVSMQHLYLQEQLIIRHRSEWVARAQNLQSKIRPHFLFNSMNSLRALMHEDVNAADQAIQNLSHLFRASLKASGEVPLEDEIALCRSYLALEQLRLGDRLNVEWILPEEDILYDMNIPSLTLQPILENAIYHGVESRSEQSVIRILIEYRDGETRIVVTNPFQEKARRRQSNGIALDNIRERLLVYYGPKAVMRLSQANNVFTTFISFSDHRLEKNMAGETE